MDLDKRISQKIKESIKAKENIRLETLRSIKSAIILIKTKSSEKKDLTENEEINLLQKLVKQRRESADIFRSQKRDDLANSEEAQLKIIKEFLPKQMEDFELEKIINDIILKVDAKSMKDMGKVMVNVNKIVAGRADSKKIAEIVKKILS
ncbi:MAG: glutamyl-tRNA amidotransferase [Flavobacteriaceae bacterium]|nr:glutamyl-tRNA amidotransferase [Flavobacteriaceae bacterium]|tara:strand:- start:14190 stop:14639 length:450 start_codon:yes stop_codon:yes gene_type:complete